MYFDEEELSEEEEERIINDIADRIHELGLETAAILFLETSKPLASIGGTVSRVFLWPFLPVFGEEADVYGQKFIEVFQRRKNVERLIQRVEELRGKKKEEARD